MIGQLFRFPIPAFLFELDALTGYKRRDYRAQHGYVKGNTLRMQGFTGAVFEGIPPVWEWPEVTGILPGAWVL